MGETERYERHLFRIILILSENFCNIVFLPNLLPGALAVASMAIDLDLFLGANDEVSIMIVEVASSVRDCSRAGISAVAVTAATSWSSV